MICSIKFSGNNLPGSHWGPTLVILSQFLFRVLFTPLCSSSCGEPKDRIWERTDAIRGKFTDTNLMVVRVELDLSTSSPTQTRRRRSHRLSRNLAYDNLAHGHVQAASMSWQKYSTASVYRTTRHLVYEAESSCSC